MNPSLELILQSLSLVLSNHVKFLFVFALITKLVPNCPVIFLGPLENRVSSLLFICRDPCLLIFLQGSKAYGMLRYFESNFIHFPWLKQHSYILRCILYIHFLFPGSQPVVWFQTSLRLWTRLYFFLNIFVFLTGLRDQPNGQVLTREIKVPVFACNLAIDLSGPEDPASSYSTGGIAVGITGSPRPIARKVRRHHHKVFTSSCESKTGALLHPLDCDNYIMNFVIKRTEAIEMSRIECASARVVTKPAVQCVPPEKEPLKHTQF